MCECMCVSVSYLRGGSDKITTVDDMKKLFRRNFILPNISVSGENKISAGMNLFFSFVAGVVCTPKESNFSYTLLSLVFSSSRVCERQRTTTQQQRKNE